MTFKDLGDGLPGSTIGIPIPPELAMMLFGMGRPDRPERDPRQLFSAIKDASEQNPGLADLARYGETLERKLQEIDQEPPTISPEQILALEQLDPARAAAGFRAVVQRLRAETKYLAELEETGVAEALEGDLREGSYGARVKFIPRDSLRWRMTKHGPGTKGAYNRLTDTCLIVDDDLPSPAQMWAKLGETGTLPDLISTLDHELTHDLQITRGQRFRALTIIGLQVGYIGTVALASRGMAIFAGVGAHTLTKNAFHRWIAGNMPDSLLSEVHAFEAAAAAPSYSNPDLDEKHEIIRNIAMGYGYGPGSLGLLSHAFDLVHSIRLLGVGDVEIGRLVSAAKQNEKGTCFPLLEKRIEAERARLGLENDGAFALFLQGAEVRQQIEIEHQRAAARRIAAEELDHFLKV